MFKRLGVVSRILFSKPGKSAIAGAVYILSLWGFSLFLGIGTNFGDNHQYSGFITSPNWGPLYLIGLPLCLFTVSILFKLLEDAIISLDEILVPVNKTQIVFSVEYFSHFQKAWRMVIVPVAILIALGIVIGADLRGIFAPIEYFDNSTLVEKDWATVGYFVNENIPNWLYLVFNLLAFTAEGILGYIGAITILSIAYPLVLFGSFSLNKLMDENDNASFIRKYKIVWKFDDAHGRCGLHKLDRVFITYVGAIGLAILLGLVSVIKNKSAGALDTGSFIVIGGVGLLLPTSFIWIILPYWINFPSKIPSKNALPKDLKNKSLSEPKPWPLGSEKISWGFLVLVTTGWLYLMKIGWNHIFPNV